MGRVAENFGQLPQTVMGDGAYGAGQNVGALHERGVELLTPMKHDSPTDDNPARRDNPTQNVPSAQWGKLPRRGDRLFDRAAFVFDQTKDCYYCPMGREMPFWQTKRESRDAGTITYRIYRCVRCDDCLLSECCRKSADTPRTIQRDEYAAEKEAVAELMSTPQAQERYRRRAWIAETPFAYIKVVMGIRQFLLRGRDKVRTEWRWICCARLPWAGAQYGKAGPLDPGDAP